MLEPLIRVAEAHKCGKADYARNVVQHLFEAFVRTEERFASKLETTDQEVIDSMRTVQVAISPDSCQSRYRYINWPVHSELSMADLQYMS